MSLSDTCCEISDDLAKGFGHYYSWDYNIQHWIKLIDAMYSINEVGAVLDVPPNFANVRLSDVVDHRVIMGLLEQADKCEARDAFISVISQIACKHDRLREGIIALNEKASSHPEQFDELSMKCLAELLPLMPGEN
jgi:hypothetical protein